MKNFKAWHLALISLAVFLIFAAIVSVIVVNNDEFHSANRWGISWRDNAWGMGFGVGKDYTIDASDSIDVDGKSNISISAVSADITIVQTTGDKLQVHLYGDYRSRNGEIKLEVTNSGSTAKIVVKYPKNSGVNTSNLTLDIQIPKDYDQDLVIGIVSSDIVFECEDMMFETVKIKNVSGIAKLNILHADSLEVTTVSGGLKGEFPDGTLKLNGVSSKINVLGITKEVNIDTVSGDIILSVEKLDEMDIDTVSGDITITLENEEEFYVDFGSVSGDFECNVPLIVIKQKSGDFEGHTGDKYATEIKAGSISGDLTIIN